MRLQDPQPDQGAARHPAPRPPRSLEAAGLQQDLERAGIHPWAWVVNNSLLAAQPESPFLRARAETEVDQIARVESLSDRVAIRFLDVAGSP